MIGQKVMDNEAKNGNKQITYQKQSSKRQKKWVIEVQRCKWRKQKRKGEYRREDERSYNGVNENTPKKNQAISTNESVKEYKSHTCG